MCCGKEITREERVRIGALYNDAHFNYNQIANKLGRHRTTISHEIKRALVHIKPTSRDGIHFYGDKVIYDVDKAQRIHDIEGRKRVMEVQINNKLQLAKKIEKLIIECKLSPEAASGYLSANANNEVWIPCGSTIRNYINSSILLCTKRDLPLKGKMKPRKEKQVLRKGRNTKGKSIEQRPQYINDRITFGHWEGDLILGKRNKKGAVLTLTERTTRFEVTCLLPDKRSESVVKGLDLIENKLMQDYSLKFGELFKSITFDNGSEFLRGKEMERSYLNAKEQRSVIYYAHSYASWERGSNENNNRMLRRAGLKKGSDFSKLIFKDVENATIWVNLYPRAIFNFKSSLDEFVAASGLPRSFKSSYAL